MVSAKGWLDPTLGIGNQSDQSAPVGVSRLFGRQLLLLSSAKESYIYLKEAGGEDAPKNMFSGSSQVHTATETLKTSLNGTNWFCSAAISTNRLSR